MCIFVDQRRWGLFNRCVTRQCRWHRAFVLWVFGVLLCGGPGVRAHAELTGREVVKRSDDLLRGDTVQGRYTMTVITPSWQRQLELEVWGQGRDKMFIRILSPAKETGIGTLRIGTSMWNYLPQVERTVKIPPSLMLQPWMGSDFTNDDLVKENSIVEDYTHQILGEEEFAGSSVYKVELTPKPEAAVIWGKRLQWIRRDDFAPLKEEYYDEGGRLVKVLTYSAIKPVSDRVIPTVWEMASTLKEGHRTIIEVVEAVYNQPIEESVFTLENLRRVE